MDMKEFSEKYPELVCYFGINHNNEIAMYINTDGYTLSEYTNYEDIYNYINYGYNVFTAYHFGIEKFLSTYKAVFKTYEDAHEYVYKQQFLIVEDSPYDSDGCMINGKEIGRWEFQKQIRNDKLKMLTGKMVYETDTWYGLYRWFK